MTARHGEVEWDQRGLAELDRRLDRAEDAVAGRIVERARGFAPVDTGRYRDSIRADRDADGAYVVADVPYAGAVEFGTSDTPAHAPVTRARDAAASDVAGAVSEVRW